MNICPYWKLEHDWLAVLRFINSKDTHKKCVAQLHLTRVKKVWALRTIYSTERIVLINIFNGCLMKFGHPKSPETQVALSVNTKASIIGTMNILKLLQTIIVSKFPFFLVVKTTKTVILCLTCWNKHWQIFTLSKYNHAKIPVFCCPDANVYANNA